MTQAKLIDFKDVKKQFVTDNGVNPVLKGIDLSIPQGSIFGIIGYSGAGKSTLIRCINGLEKPTTGEVTFDGQVVNQLNNRQLLQLRGSISMIFQQFNLLPNLTIAQNVALPIQYKHFSKKEIDQKVTKLLDLVGLSDKASAYPASLSGGQQQRIAIARALVNDPKVLLCDEATSALDPETTTSILQLLKELNTKYDITVIVVTHEMNVIESICDHVAVLDHGNIVEQGETYQVFASPKDPLTKRFVNAASNIDLPKDFINTLHLKNGEHLLQITYQSGSTVEPLISYLSRKFDVNVNIITGNVKLLQGQLLGNLVVVLEGESAAIKDARDYLLNETDIRLEVLSDVK